MGQGALEPEAPVPNAWKKSLLPNGGPATGWHQDKPAMPGTAGAAAPAATAPAAAAPRSRFGERPPKDLPQRDSSQPAPPAPVPSAVKQAAARMDELDAPEEPTADGTAELTLGEALAAAPPVPAEPVLPKGPPMSWRKVLAGAARDCGLSLLPVSQARLLHIAGITLGGKHAAPHSCVWHAGDDAPQPIAEPLEEREPKRAEGGRGSRGGRGRDRDHRHRAERDAHTSREPPTGAISFWGTEQLWCHRLLG